MPQIAQDLTGNRVGLLTVICFDGARNGHRYWTCQCVCGMAVVRSTQQLKRARTNSCGCARRKVGRSTDTYSTWGSMMQRCTNPKRVDYPLYGGRGIGVCERWLSFDNFLADLGEKPAGTSIERIDNDRGYEPGNVRWATPVEQSQNRRSTRLTIDQVREIRTRRSAGESYSSLSHHFGVSQTLVRYAALGITWKNVE
jgi:hypothetical protein